MRRYARWSLGFVDPPLEVSGTGDRCKISALNSRGRVLLDPVLDAMGKLLDGGILSDVVHEGDVIDVRVAPPAEVGSFSEEERSRQVSSGVVGRRHLIVALLVRNGNCAVFFAPRGKLATVRATTCAKTHTHTHANVIALAIARGDDSPHSSECVYMQLLQLLSWSCLDFRRSYASSPYGEILYTCTGENAMVWMVHTRHHDQLAEPCGRF